MTFVGRVGADLIGSALVEELERAGVTVRAARDRHHPTGTVAVSLERMASGASSPPEEQTPT